LAFSILKVRREKAEVEKRRKKEEKKKEKRRRRKRRGGKKSKKDWRGDRLRRKGIILTEGRCNTGERMAM
jgi:hypothetical protein